MKRHEREEERERERMTRTNRESCVLIKCSICSFVVPPIADCDYNIQKEITCLIPSQMVFLLL